MQKKLEVIASIFYKTQETHLKALFVQTTVQDFSKKSFESVINF